MANINLLLLLSLGFIIPCCTGLCEFPSTLRANWYSTDKGILNFTASSLVEYPVFLSSNVSNMTFSCEEINANRYILKGVTTFTVFGNQLRPYLCLTLTQVSEDVFYYYVINRLESSNNDRIFVRDDNFTVTADDICNRKSPYELSTYILLLREGADSNSISRTCPNILLRRYQNVSIVSSDGNDRCDAVQLDVCTNTSVLNITYQSCPASLIYSDGGEFVCLFDVIENGVTYITLWNTDVALTAGQTYRTSCYAIEKTNDVTFGTEFPDRCHYNQSSQYSPPGGVYITMQNLTENCVPVVQAGGSPEEAVTVATIIGGVAGGVVFLVAIIVCLIGCFCCKHTKATVIIVKEVGKAQHRPKDTDIIVDEDDEDESVSDGDLTDKPSAQMNIYSPYLPRSPVKGDHTKTRFQKPPFGSPLYRDLERGNETRYKRSTKQNGRLVENGVYGIEDESEMSFPVEQTSLPDIRKDVYQNSAYGQPDDGFAFQDLAVGATDNYKLLVKNMKRGEKNLMSKSPPGQRQVVHVRSSPGERQKITRNKSNSPPSRQRFRGSENKEVNLGPRPGETSNGHDRFVWSNEDEEEIFQDPDFTGSDIYYGGRPTGPNVYGKVQVENNTVTRNGTVHRKSSFGSGSNKTLHSYQNVHSDIGSEVGSTSPLTSANQTADKQSSGGKNTKSKSYVTKDIHLVDSSTNTEETKQRTITPKTVNTGVSVGIQTEVESTSVTNVSRKDSPIPARKVDPWRNPLLNLEFYGNTDMKKSTSVPTVISGYEMAKYNPPNIESSKHRDRLVRRLGLTSNDMVWCIEPNSRVPKRSATYNLGSNINRNDSHRLARKKSRSRIVTPWK